MSQDNKYPEQRARDNIDKLLQAAGWVVQDNKTKNIGAARGVAVREFPIPGGFIDYLLYVDRKVIGAIEAKKEGAILTNVEPQSKGHLGATFIDLQAQHAQGAATLTENRDPLWLRRNEESTLGREHRRPTCRRSRMGRRRRLGYCECSSYLGWATGGKWVARV